MIQTEAQLEQQFIEKLQELNYIYRSDIRDIESLERNFREKFERLNFVSLSDDEFRKLLQETSLQMCSLHRSICVKSRPLFAMTVQHLITVS